MKNDTLVMVRSLGSLRSHTCASTCRKNLRMKHTTCPSAGASDCSLFCGPLSNSGVRFPACQQNTSPFHCGVGSICDRRRVEIWSRSHVIVTDSLITQHDVGGGLPEFVGGALMDPNTVRCPCGADAYAKSNVLPVEQTCRSVVNQYLHKLLNKSRYKYVLAVQSPTKRLRELCRRLPSVCQRWWRIRLTRGT